MPEVRLKPVFWVGSSLDDLKTLPIEVQRFFGYALYGAQRGERHPKAKALKGFHGAGVLEIVEDHDGDTYRVVYTVRFTEVLYVLHAFQKKSKHGIATPRHDLDLIQSRLNRAEEDYKQWMDEKETNSDEQ
ncbi:MAG: type II toxin-antitoxin system RelE/ParE family toxin [Armatimonadetes bacterium]|nr:type II toxin-antitoxin system RelE/ParE family toxin [Armatimonadota bacterium]